MVRTMQGPPPDRNWVFRQARCRGPLGSSTAADVCRRARGAGHAGLWWIISAGRCLLLLGVRGHGRLHCLRRGCHPRQIRKGKWAFTPCHAAPQIKFLRPLCNACKSCHCNPVLSRTLRRSSGRSPKLPSHARSQVSFSSVHEKGSCKEAGVRLCRKTRAADAHDVCLGADLARKHVQLSLMILAWEPTLPENTCS